MSKRKLDEAEMGDCRTGESNTGGSSVGFRTVVLSMPYYDPDLLGDPDRDEKATSSEDDDPEFTPSVPYKRPKGGVGHLVWFDGHEGSTKFGDKDRSDDWDELHVTPPPPPPKYLRDKYGIEFNHADLSTATAASSDGDRIYVLPAERCFGMDSGLDIDKAVEIIGLGRTPEDTVIFRDGSDSITISSRMVRLRNLTIRYGHYGEFHIRNDGAKPDPLIQISDEDADLYLENCLVDMGTPAAFQESRRIMRNRAGDAGLAGLHQSAVSGVHVVTGESVIVRNCRFVGGCGSALSVAYDPARHFPRVEVIGSTFEGTGQSPLKMPSGSDEGGKDARELERRGLPRPAAVELWRIKRTEYEADRQLSIVSRPDICLLGNTFRNNLQAPVAYRSFVDEDDETEDERRDKVVIYKASNKGRKDGASHVYFDEFDIVFKKNTAENNGLGMVGNKMLYVESGRTLDEKKKTKLGPAKSLTLDSSTKFPAGDTVLSAGKMDYFTDTAEGVFNRFIWDEYD